ncbi:MAG: hypothetical protein U1A27_09325 [Phycisphaerae bacterium]
MFFYSHGAGWGFMVFAGAFLLVTLARTLYLGFRGAPFDRQSWNHWAGAHGIGRMAPTLDCPSPACCFRNRRGARFCARCGTKLL